MPRYHLKHGRPPVGSQQMIWAIAPADAV
jgi:hypothetical protein